jgi:hypothetical protein
MATRSRRARPTRRNAVILPASVSPYIASREGPRPTRVAPRLREREYPGAGGRPPHGRAQPAPTASFTATSTSGRAPLNVSLDALASSDPNGTIVTYAREFGGCAKGSGARRLTRTRRQGRSRSRATSSLAFSATTRSMEGLETTGSMAVPGTIASSEAEETTSSSAVPATIASMAARVRIVSGRSRQRPPLHAGPHGRHRRRRLRSRPGPGRPPRSRAERRAPILGGQASSRRGQPRPSP